MRGSIIEHNGSLRLKVSLGKNTQTGKYESYYETFHGNRTEAQKRLRQMLTELDKGSFINPGKLTVGEYLEQWLKDYCWPNLSPRSAESYQYIVRSHLIPSFGRVLLTGLKPEHLQHLYSEKLTNGLSNRTVQYCHSTLHKALDSALKLGLVSRNVADSVERPKIKRREIQTMNESDIYRFLEMARPTQYYSLFYILLFTGLRRSESLALRWSDVDLLICQLSVNRTLHQLHNGKIVFGQPKTNNSRRTIALSPSTVIVLREHKEQQEQLRQSLDITFSDNDLVFCQYDGKPLLPDSITHTWHRLILQAGLKGIRLHDARHSHASLMLKQGVHPKVVSERLGHASIQITLDTYSHVAPGLQEAAAKGFDNILNAESKLDKELKEVVRS